MKVSIVIPQLFYDLIARILPGFLFLVLIIICNPGIYDLITISNYTAGTNFIQSIGLGFYFIIISYFLGWLFNIFTYPSQEKSTKNANETGSKSLKTQYQWIRLSNPEAGFRLVKLRAEARMLETTRTAMSVVVIVGIISLTIRLLNPSPITAGDTNYFGIRHSIIIVAAILFYIGCFIKERDAWDTYWGNIKSIYKVLHDKDDPIKGLKRKKAD